MNALKLHSPAKSRPSKGKGIEVHHHQHRCLTDEACEAMSKLGNLLFVAQRKHDAAIDAWLAYAYDEVFGFPRGEETMWGGGSGEAEKIIDELIWLRDRQWMRNDIPKKKIKEYVGRIWHIQY